MSKYWIRNPVHYGYITNIERAVQLALIHCLVIHTRAERNGIESYTAALVSAAAQWLSWKVPLLELIGWGRESLYWTFHRQMMKPYRLPEAAQRLEKFKDIMDLDDEALLKASTDGTEPAPYKTLDTP